MLILAYVSKPVKQALEMHPRYDAWSGVVQNNAKEEEATTAVDAEYGPFEDPLTKDAHRCYQKAEIQTQRRVSSQRCGQDAKGVG